MKCSAPLAVCRTFLSLSIGLLAVGGAHATSAPFTNPFSGAGESTTYVAAFTATATGTLNAYFVSSNSTGFTDGLGFYTADAGTAAQNSAAAALINGQAPSLATASDPDGLTMSSATNKSATFGTQMLSINVVQGETFYFVESANETNVHYISGTSNYYIPQGCSQPTSGAPTGNCAIDQSQHYVWSDEEATSGGATGFANSGNSAMVYTTAYDSSGTITNPNNGTNGTGTIAAGNYTYVGFNDWLGGQSNSYDDVSFLFTISCASGTGGCGSSGGGTSSTAPEPSSLALAALGLFGVVRVGRRAAVRKSA